MVENDHTPVNEESSGPLRFLPTLLAQSGVFRRIYFIHMLIVAIVGIGEVFYCGIVAKTILEFPLDQVKDFSSAFSFPMLFYFSFNAFVIYMLLRPIIMSYELVCSGKQPLLKPHAGNVLPFNFPRDMAILGFSSVFISGFVAVLIIRKMGFVTDYRGWFVAVMITSGSITSAIFYYLFSKMILTPLVEEMMTKNSEVVWQGKSLGLRNKFILLSVIFTFLPMVWIGWTMIQRAVYINHSVIVKQFLSRTITETDARRAVGTSEEETLAFLSSQRIGEEGRVFVVDQSKNILTPVEQEFIPDIKKYLSRIVKVDDQGDSIPIYYTGKMLSFVLLPDLQWILCCISSEDDFLRPSQIANSNILMFALFSVLFPLIIGLMFARDTSVQTNRLVSAVEEVTQGNIHSNIALVNDDEIETVGRRFVEMLQRLQDVLGKIHQASQGFGSASQIILLNSAKVFNGAQTQKLSITEASSSIEGMSKSIKEISENSQVLATSAEESSRSIGEIGNSITEVGTSVEKLADSAEQTATSISEVTAAINQIAENVEGLAIAAEETSSAITQMDSSIKEVEVSAEQTSKLSERVFADAEQGARSVQSTIDGILEIKDYSERAEGVIDRLGKRILEIGNILEVIDDVTEKTNLLALNAAIIAAQAGEHGKGFAVVADEIKDLAERTGASTKEIAGMIKATQSESTNAISTMKESGMRVDEGVKLSQEAGGALQEILQSAMQATRMIKKIAVATIEQTSSSRKVTESVEHMADRIQRISNSTKEQASGSQRISAASEGMKEITLRVRESIREQSRMSEKITLNIKNITELGDFINQSQMEQRKSSEQMVNTMQNILHITDNNVRSVSEMEEAIRTLAKQAEELKGEVGEFTLQGNREVELSEAVE